LGMWTPLRDVEQNPSVVVSSILMPGLLNFADNSQVMASEIRYGTAERRYELSNHLGNVLVVVSDRKIGVANASGVITSWTAQVLDAQDYAPFGMVMPGRKFSANIVYGGANAPQRYRYGFNGQERDTDVGENINTAMFWEYDARIGRRWNVDPKPNISVSPYNCFGGNPIFYSDYLGDKIKGANQTSANRMLTEIQGTFKGDKAAKLRNLFKLSSDKVTMQSINEKDFTAAVSGLSADEQKLAYGYYNAINSSDVHTVEMVYRSESLSTTAATLFGKSKGSDFDDLTYGGANTKTSNTSTYSVIMMDNQKQVGDYINSSGASSFRSSSPGELISHEVLGHGVGTLRNSATAYYQDAIQMSNLYLRIQGTGYYRDGSWHGKKSSDAVLSKSTANQTPSFVQIPATMQSQITVIKKAQREAELKVLEEAAQRMRAAQELNRHNDRLVNPIGERRPVLPMGGW
jgi:hypothetical protein